MKNYWLDKHKYDIDEILYKVLRDHMLCNRMSISSITSHKDNSVKIKINVSFPPLQ